MENSSGYRYEDGIVPFVWTGEKWEQKAGASWKNPGFEQTGEHPVTCVSYDDAVAFCAWLTKKERANLPEGAEYRLPMDVEWSWAVGIGREEGEGKTPKEKDEKIPDVYPWGTSFPPKGKVGNYADASMKRKFPSLSAIDGYEDGYATTSPVGSYKDWDKNPFGVLDLGGNVWEWCGSYYDGSSGSRVLRGGSWRNCDGVYLLSSCRFSFTPAFRDGNYGFRCVLVVSGS